MTRHRPIPLSYWDVRLGCLSLRCCRTVATEGSGIGAFAAGLLSVFQCPGISKHPDPVHEATIVQARRREAWQKLADICRRRQSFQASCERFRVPGPPEAPVDNSCVLGDHLFISASCKRLALYSVPLIFENASV